MQPLGIVLDERYQRHLTGPGHPERPARLDAVRAGLERSGLPALSLRIEPQPITQALLERVHTRDCIDRLRTACRDKRAFIDTPDSAICPESHDIALLAAGGVVEAARLVGSAIVRRAFCAVRPPGHHAEADRSMGFCLFNNVALAATALREEFNFKRVLILDWDVHHGNGTQHLFEDDPAVQYISLHGHPDHLYPGSGYEHEIGLGPGAGFTLNLPFVPGIEESSYRQAFTSRVVPAVERFEPQVVLISAGFDGHADDPLGILPLSDDTFAWMTRQAVTLAQRYADGRVLSVLEGGYDLEVLRRCVGEHVRLLREA